MISYLIVGSGYRAEYFGRIAGRYPELFRAMFLCRSEEKVKLMKAHTGIESTKDEQTALDFAPDFVVVAVDRGHMAEVAGDWAEKGFSVLAETPVGETEDQLRSLLRLQQQGAKISCCEQYHRQPLIANGLKALAEGVIGKPSSMYISLLHDYHAASLIRKGMGIPADEPYHLWVICSEEPVVETDSRAGAIWNGRIKSEQRMTALIVFASGKQVIYDFCPIQYRSYIRSRHLVIRGEKGEWSDSIISYIDKAGEPQKRFLLPEIPEKYRCLDTQELRDRRRNWQDELAPDTVQDEFAIATFLLDMGEYLNGGESPYPLTEAVADASLWLALKRAAVNPMCRIDSEGMIEGK